MTRSTLKLPSKKAGDANSEPSRDPARKPIRGGNRATRNQPRAEAPARDEAPRRSAPRSEESPRRRSEGEQPRREGSDHARPPRRSDAPGKPAYGRDGRDSRNERNGEAPRRPRREDGERPYSDRDRPARGKPAGRDERPPRQADGRPPRRSDGPGKPAYARDGRDGDAPRGPRAPRREDGERSYGERKPGAPFGKPRSEDGRPPRRGDAPARPAYARDGERAERPRREGGERTYGDRERPFRGKPAGDFAKPARRFDDAPRRPAPRRDDAATGERSADARPPRGDRGNPSELPRLSKVMSEQGLCSRREADEWIEAGWVKVDGKVVSELGSRIVPTARIEVDPEARKHQAESVTIILHKPIGYVSGQAEDGYEPAVVLVQPENRWEEDKGGTRFKSAHLRRLAPAGRLDIDSTGMLVLTQDGRVAKRLIGEDSTVEKEYLVRVEGELIENGLALLNHGLSLDGVKLKPAHVSWQNEEQLRFVLREGRKRQIRRMCELVGLKVVGLKRIRIGSVVLGKLPPGQWRYLRSDEKF
ncbi:23S rRNA pseudouridine2604 synthase [Azospira oryzae]|uniref:Dual-specificity RNA pseudouridine synthase RluF n=1 Tax=Azospira oryzae TaxID=146939 RepID=A0ABY0IRW0_9RHOO|nr:pseudouridine synthase [Azospira oryzae]RZT90004.1 23S rRNA pseudouridine2604 synthase [Azospira oryzae]